jgi:transposase
MGNITIDLSAVATVGLDLAKHVFQVHAVDAAGHVVTNRALRRKDVLAFFESLPRCLIGLEACGSAHHWAREFMKFGHDVRLMPPAYVKAYVRRQKNDAADAAAICEAVTRPSMRFVPVRSVGNQAALMHHKVRELLVGQRTQLLNALRSHLAEIGIIAAQGPNNARALATLVIEGNDIIPATVRSALLPLVRQLSELDAEIYRADRCAAANKSDPSRSRRRSNKTSVRTSILRRGPARLAAYRRRPCKQTRTASSSGISEHLRRVIAVAGIDAE